MVLITINIIIIIAIIVVPYNFNIFYNTLRIATLDTFKNNTLKTEILDSVTLIRQENGRWRTKFSFTKSDFGAWGQLSAILAKDRPA